MLKQLFSILLSSFFFSIVAIGVIGILSNSELLKIQEWISIVITYTISGGVILKIAQERKEN